MIKANPPIKWHGGKHYLAAQIIDLMPEHTHYVEPYFGGGAVLLRKDPHGVSEVVNDINFALTNFWRVVQDPECFAMFRRLVPIPFSEIEWNDAADYEPTCDRDVEAAVRFFVRARQSRQGLMRDFATLSRNRTRRAMNEQASSWLTAVEGLPDVHDRLRRVVILNRDALSVIRSQDGPRTLFYLDPPYLHETRTCRSAYAHEMSVEQHADLLDLLGTIEGRFILSGYPSELYADAANRHGWGCQRITIDNKASSAKTKAIKTECLWTNFLPTDV